MTLLHFTQHYCIPPAEEGEPQKRTKEIVVIIRPYYPPDPDGPKYEQYCRQKLMLHKSFRDQQELLCGHNTYTAAYAEHLQSGNIPACLEDDIHRLEQQTLQQHDDHDQDSQQLSHQRPIEDWMLICQHHPDLGSTQGDNE